MGISQKFTTTTVVVIFAQLSYVAHQKQKTKSHQFGFLRWLTQLQRRRQTRGMSNCAKAQTHPNSLHP